MKSTVFWNIKPCSPLIVNRRFGGTYRLHLQGRTMWWARYQLCLQPASPWYLARLILQTWRWKRYVPPKRRLTFNGLHGLSSRKTVLFFLKHLRRCIRIKVICKVVLVIDFLEVGVKLCNIQTMKSRSPVRENLLNAQNSFRKIAYSGCDEPSEI
jgi:hypothetical protein